MRVLIRDTEGEKLHSFRHARSVEEDENGNISVADGNGDIVYQSAKPPFWYIAAQDIESE